MLACKDYIQQCTFSADEDVLWQCVQLEIASRHGDGGIDPHHKYLQNQLDAKLKVAREVVVKS